MKILVLSDSHSSLRFMRYCIDKVMPAHIIHLGDHYDDGKAMAEQYPHILFHQVPGNCDRFRCEAWLPEVLCYDIAGVRMFMTHGHKHGVKSGNFGLLRSARENGAAIALYGHTHQPVCRQHDDGLWELNPGACGSWGGSVGLIEVQDGNISSCRILRQEDLEGLS